MPGHANAAYSDAQAGLDSHGQRDRRRGPIAEPVRGALVSGLVDAAGPKIVGGIGQLLVVDAGDQLAAVNGRGDRTPCVLAAPSKLDRAAGDSRGAVRGSDTDARRICGVLRLELQVRGLVV